MRIFGVVVSVVLEREIVEVQMSLLHSFAKSLSYYRTIRQDYDRLKSDKAFWSQVMNTALLRAVTDWCAVFGANSNETHWKKVVSVQNKEFETEVRAMILIETNLSAIEWQTYWQKMCDFRNSYASHRDPSYNQPVPHMEHALTIACCYFEWLKAQLRPAQNEPPELKLYYANFPIEVLGVMKAYLPVGT
jgi:hypothetical protein